jgi:hypothetical protein
MKLSHRIALTLLVNLSGLGIAARPVCSQQYAATERETVPRLLQFSGALKDASSRPLTGPVSVTFALYSDQDGGTALWYETQNVLADANGHYSVLLGAATTAGIPAELFGTGQSRWLGVTVGRQQEMSRILLASVPYALKAADAETLGGLPASAYVTTESLAARTTPSSTTIITPPQNAASAPNTNAATNASPQTTPTGIGTTNYLPLWTSSSTLGNSLMYQTGGKIGIGTTTPTETLDVNGNSIFRGSFQLPPGHPAIAASGYESHSFQFQASSYNSSTKASTTQSFGFRAEPLNNNTTNPSAQLDLFFIPNGGSDFEYTGVSWSSTGIQTFAPGQTFNGASETLTGSLNLPDTTNINTGVIDFAGQPFITDFPNNSNIFVGNLAGGKFQTTTANGGGYQNTAVGMATLYLNVDGAFNTAIGASALENNTEGSDNTGVGEFALHVVQTGSHNTAIGAEAGSSFDGSNNTFVGASAQPGSTGLTNATAIGANAQVNASNSMVLGSVNGVNGATVSTHVGIGTSSPTAPLHVVDDGHGAILAVSSIAGDNTLVGDNLATSGTGIGGFFYSASASGTGVVGENTAGGLAGEFFGNVQVNGTLSKSAGSFKIDDPVDPANKYLSHSFVESPDMKNIYDGMVVTDAKGYATVTMPNWFEALNGEFRYQLTPMNSFARATITQEIHDGKFRIRTNHPNVKVSWQVTGIRRDAYANAHRIPTEEEKPASEQGHYLHPELFGAAPEMGISASPHSDAEKNTRGRGDQKRGGDSALGGGN